MSGWLKSGLGSSSPLEEPKSPTTSPAQVSGGRRVLGTATKTKKEKPWATRTAPKPTPQHNVSEYGHGTRPDADAQGLSAYREQLRKHMSSRSYPQQPPLSPKRPSPIQEESSPPGIRPSEPGTASTESGATIRGAPTPGITARTPSYPFPRMITPGHVPSHLHRPFTTLSPSGIPLESSHSGRIETPNLLDKIMSNPSTPGATLTFNPTGVPQSAEEHPEFPTPNLYDLSLMLSAEPGLDAWWNTVVQIMTAVYKAERVTLAVPADTTDIENVPWGQKATYNARGEDELSVGYMARGSSMVPSSNDGVSETTSQQADPYNILSPLRPNLPSRHSFTAFENRQAQSMMQETAATLRRPTALTRSKSSVAATPADENDPELAAATRPALNKKTLEEHDAAEREEVEKNPAWEVPFQTTCESQGRVLPMLQALDYEADPLIDHNGISRVLERGKLIALTRTYPYLDEPSAEHPEEHKGRARSRSQEGSRTPQQGKRSRPEPSSKLSSLFGGTHLYKGPKGAHSDKRRQTTGSRFEQDVPRPPIPKYEEYEQAPPSPWSQSPAPSPAIRSDHADNPFFTDAVVDEDSFNPVSPPIRDYRAAKPPQAIGVDNSFTVLHVPLSHIILSKPNPTFKLDATLMERKSHMRNKSVAKGGVDAATPAIPSSPESVSKEKHSPIAVLSILSPLIPYPSNLRHSLEYLAPHLATSFSLCRHYTNLETEIAGLQRRSAQSTSGLLSGQMSLESLAYLPVEAPESRMSIGGGSITSPSDYSVPSRSATGSAIGTPSWEVGGLGLTVQSEKRQVTSSPTQVAHPTTTAAAAATCGDSYFNVNPLPSPTHQAAALGGFAGGAGQQRERDRGSSKESFSCDRRASRRFSGAKGQSSDSVFSSPEAKENEALREGMSKVTTADVPASTIGMTEKIIDAGHDVQSSQKMPATGVGTAPPPAVRSGHRHTQLHSHGADFSTTFQSLPPSSTIGTRAQEPPSRRGSVSAARELLPPSDTLKGLILDALPAQVFVAVPPTGDMVWVNSRYLSYRGVTATQLAADPYGSLHPHEREDYIKAWVHSLRTGDPFSRTVRIRRFDGAYRWFQARAIATRDKRNLVQQFLGSYMDIHDQHIAELKAARQEEIEASEAKHRLLANLIPQIIFTATEDEGITFANEQWLSYTGQSFEDSLGLGFMDFVHPDDLANCRIPMEGPPTPLAAAAAANTGEGARSSVAIPNAAAPGTLASLLPELASRATASGPLATAKTPKLLPNPETAKEARQATSRRNSSSSASCDEPMPRDISKLAKKGAIKVAIDSNGRLSYTTEVRLRSKSGEYRWHLVRCVEIDNIDFGSGASSYFGSATDINDHKLLEAKLKEAMDSKSRFLSNMSHEIRTPLIGISGMVSFLQDTTLNEEQRDYTNTIHTSASSLIMIINDILDLSKVDAGMMKLNYEWFHTTSLIEAVNELVSTMAIAKRLELNYIVDPDVPAWVKGDKVRIRQVLLNVIGNAIKFTSEGEVFSRCSVVSPKPAGLDEHEIMLEFSIVDTGRGFTKEEAELIFKPFSQIDGSSTRQHGGSGLGLVISRQLVELHGGKMDGTAVPGKGSTFTFTAKFGLPTESDVPELPGVPGTPGIPHLIGLGEKSGPRPNPPISEGLETAQLFKGSSVHKTREESPIPSPTTVEPLERSGFSPIITSSGSSDPSVRSSQSALTQRSSMSSLNAAGLVHFSEAARASGQDLSQMKLAMPSGKSSSDSTLSADELKPSTTIGVNNFKPLLYSILIISPQNHSREATTKHIEMTLPKDVPHQITALATTTGARKLIGGDDPVIFTHVVINLPSNEELLGLMDELTRSKLHSRTSILILSDSVQKQALLKMVAGTPQEEILSDDKVTYIYKPVKPSRFAVIFDPSKERDLSIDHNRSTAQKIVETQKQSYQEVARRLGNKGYKVLLVEDNPINQKVLLKYLKKVGVDVEVAYDGEDCTEKVFSRPRSYYSLILCDLHMPQKDGYQACREVREWEKKDPASPRLPIIALSANVMSDVQEKCVQAGFDAYITKPVDFIDLSNTLSRFF